MKDDVFIFILFVRESRMYKINYEYLLLIMVIKIIVKKY